MEINTLSQTMQEQRKEALVSLIETSFSLIPDRLVRKKISENISNYISEMIPSIRLGRRQGHTTALKHLLLKSKEKYVVVCHTSLQIKELSQNLKTSSSIILFSDFVKKASLYKDSNIILSNIRENELLGIENLSQYNLIFVGN